MPFIAKAFQEKMFSISGGVGVNEQIVVLKECLQTFGNLGPFYFYGDAILSQEESGVTYS